MTKRLRWIPGFWDVRRDELGALVTGFIVLLLLITAHTILETARDALVLTRLPSRALGIVYVAVAACALPAAAVASHATERLGPRRTLAGGLVTAALLLVAFFVAPANRATSVAVYVTSALIGAVLVPQYWNLLGTIFNIAQAGRLLGILGAAAVLGGALGSLAAAGLLSVAPVKVLLLVSAGVLLTTGGALTWMPPEQQVPLPQADILPSRRATAALREEPFLGRIALLVIVATIAALFLDYLFKWSVARSVPNDEIARFVARYYVLLNGLSLVAQTFVTGALVRRVGVATTMVVTPALLLIGGVGALLTGGALTAVLALKGIDGTLHNSLHRVTTELVYLPVPQRVRARAKPFIDGALARVTQATGGIVLLALGSTNALSARLLAALAVAAAGAWLAVAVTTRGPYLALLRHAVLGDSLALESDGDRIDEESAEKLVEYLAHEDRLVVLGAMNALSRRGRERSIPALILLHEDEAVLVRALGIFGPSPREDWIARARKLLEATRDSVRIAAARALAMHGRLDAREVLLKGGPRLYAYASLHLALAEPADPLDKPEVARLLDLPGKDGEEARLGLLAVVADAKADPRLSRLLVTLEKRAGSSREWTQLLAKAATSQGATNLIPSLVQRLVERDSFEAVGAALVLLGRPAMDYLWAALCDRTHERRLRVRLPGAIARFGTKPAADLLLRCIESEHDGLVRYKAIRALGRVVANRGVSVDRVRVERLSLANLVEHFRLLSLRAPFVDSPMSGPRSPTEQVLVGLLDDKLRQSLERTFRLLKIAHPRDDIHRVQIAAVSQDIGARANAAAFLDALLRGRDQRSLRELLLVVADDLSVDERVARASTLLHRAPLVTREAALARMVDDADAALAALASLHVAAIAGEPVRVAIGGFGERPPVELTTPGVPAANRVEGAGGLADA
ncbi:MAG: MFS transporter [Polyangiaceae bacterium]